MLLLNPLPQRLDTGATPTFAGLLAGDGTAAAPSISFASDSDTGFYRVTSGLVGFASNGVSSLIFRDGGSISGNGAQFITLNSGGAISLAGGGTNQNITLTPSGTGVVNFSNGQILLTNGNSVIGSTGNIYLDAGGGGNILLRTGKTLVGTGALDSGNGILQLATHTTSAGGIGFGTDISLYRRTSATLALAPSGGTGEVYLEFFSAATRAGYIQTNGTTELIINGSATLRLYTGGSQALNFDSSQVATFAKAVATTNGTITANTGTGANTLVGVNTSATGFGGYLRGGSTIGSGKYLLQLVNYDASKNYLFYDDIALFPGALTLGGALKLNNAYVAGAVVGTGYVTIQDSTGTTYRVPVLV